MIEADVNRDAYISNGTIRAPKQALRLRFCEELCPGKLQNDGEMTDMQSTRTGRKTRCQPGKHPGMLYIGTRDRGGCDDVMRKSPIALVINAFCNRSQFIGYSSRLGHDLVL